MPSQSERQSWTLMGCPLGRIVVSDGPASLGVGEEVPVVPCDDAAVERAARGLCEYGVLTVDGEVATWERHHRKLTQMARIALNCAGDPSYGLEGNCPVDQSDWPAHLRDDAPYKTCDTCGRKSWSTECRVGTSCGMPQPTGGPCEGHFRA